METVLSSQLAPIEHNQSMNANTSLGKYKLSPRIGNTQPEAGAIKEEPSTIMESTEHLSPISRDDSLNEDRSPLAQIDTGTSSNTNYEKKKEISKISRVCGPFKQGSWLSHTYTLCSLPSSLRLVDDRTIDNESRSDSNSRTVDRYDDRQETKTPHNFEVEIEEEGSHTQIEIKHSYENSCDWSSTDDTVTESFCEADDSFHSMRPAHCMIIENENVIENLLEKNRFICTGLDTWYNQEDDEPDPIEMDVPAVPRNRSAFPEGRKKRIEHLKINLTPFELDNTILVKSSVNSRKYSPVQRVRSFSEYKGFVSPIGVATTVTPTKPYSCYTLPSCQNTYGKGSALIDWDENDEEDLCYDSDPNELLVSSPMMAQKRKEKNIGSVVESAMDNSDPTVSELMGTKILLVWHRPMHTESSPIAVHAWIEHGSYIQAGLIQPKLMWQESCGKERKDGERFVLNEMEFHSVDLLDISRVVPLSRVDRTLYPFAKRSCCFFIQAFDKELIFEAESTADRDNFIGGLKVLVARLGSKIIVGDKDVLEEFFTPASSEVPGTAPSILMEGTC